MESGQQLDWKNLGFGYHPTDYNVRCYYRNGQWGEWEVSSSDMITIPMASTCLHYGQESFEGLKAFRGKDGKVRVFRPEENAARMQHTSRGILMPELPTERFLEALDMVLRLNKDFIPPYERGASLYIRPLMICSPRDWAVQGRGELRCQPSLGRPRPRQGLLGRHLPRC